MTTRLVVKVGSALLHGQPALFDALAADIAAGCEAGAQIVLVSSGAIALGRDRLGFPSGPLGLDQKQAAAAAGQPALIAAWAKAFEAHGLIPAQALLTLDVTESRRRWLNARSTLDALLAAGATPIVNENDTVATDEIRYGDNDRLAARVAQLIGAERLILLSDIDGLHTADPRKDPQARHLPRIERIDDSVRAMAGGADTAGKGTGGMRTKIAAAEIAAASGCRTVIARGVAERPLRRLEYGALQTVFEAATSRSGARRAWIAGAMKPGGRLIVDAGAAQALRGGKSLLPAGVTAVEGAFERGDAVEIAGPEGSVLARGISAYDAADASAIAGAQTSEIETRLGYRRGAALAHADDILILDAEDGDA